ncbi:CCDC90 family protein [Rhodobacteraceae bacterium]|nr:CCDC90 family protein [Paracoccaceae bacterium]
MSTFALDTHKTIQKLQAKGFSSDQAEGIVDALTDSELITKSDLHTALKLQTAEIKTWVAVMLIAQAALVVTLQNVLG